MKNKKIHKNKYKDNILKELLNLKASGKRYKQNQKSIYSDGYHDGILDFMDSILDFIKKESKDD